METKVCGKCKQEKSISEFYPSKRDGYRSRCKPCSKEDSIEYGKTGYHARYQREYSKKPEVKERTNKQKKEYRRSPEVRIKCLARWYANRMLRNGVIDKQPCAVCGKDNSQMHHPNYNEPLLIVWLCGDCHSALHRRVK